MSNPREIAGEQRPSDGLEFVKTKSAGRVIIYILPVLYIIADIAGIYFSFIVAFSIRFYTGLLGEYPVYYKIPELSVYMTALMLVTPIWIIFFAFTGQYKRRLPRFRIGVAPEH